MNKALKAIVGVGLFALALGVGCTRNDQAGQTTGAYQRDEQTADRGTAPSVTEGQPGISNPDTASGNAATGGADAGTNTDTSASTTTGGATPGADTAPGTKPAE